MEDPGFIAWVGRVRKAFRREFESRAAELEITASQFQVLRRLWKGDGILTSMLTRDCSSDGGTITGLLDRLEAKDLIRRERCTDDRRAVRVFLTDGGWALETPLTAILKSLNDEAMAGFDEDERKRLWSALERISKNIGAQ